jgi:hypothetical protein
MGKLIFWIVVVFGILFGLRLLNASKLRRGHDAGSGGAPAAMPMIRCVDCGVFLPRTDATTAPDGYRCGDPACPNRKRRSA